MSFRAHTPAPGTGAEGRRDTLEMAVAVSNAIDAWQGKKGTRRAAMFFAIDVDAMVVPAQAKGAVLDLLACFILAAAHNDQIAILARTIVGMGPDALETEIAKVRGLDVSAEVPGSGDNKR